MPNHVYSVLKFRYHYDDGEKIQYIIDTIKGEDLAIDFNKLIPQPITMQDERHGRLSDERLEWRIQNWGTKWNAYDQIIKQKDTWRLVVHFKTAWSIPKPIIDNLFDKFPNVHIEFVAADDGGWFAYHIKKGNNEDPVVNLWDNSNDKDGTVRSAMFEALNYSY